MNTQNRMKFNRGIKNIFFGLISQFVILLLSLIIPRLFIVNYGSEVNGLFSFMTQMFGYFTLLEAGIGIATVQALYKPIAEKDISNISGVLSATKEYYKKVSYNYLILVVVFAIVYPLFAKTSINKFTIATVILLQGLTGVTNYFYQATLKQFVIADGRAYIISNINLVLSICTNTFKIALIYIGVNIILIQVVYFIISLLEMFLYHLYYKKNLTWVNFKVKPDFNALKQKTSILVHQISGMIFSSTDMLILAFFCNLSVVSKYAIYNMVMMAINTLVSTIINSVLFILGHTYYEDKKRYILLHDTYNVCYITFIFSIMTICYILYAPFIKLYTVGTDINYVDKYLPLLFCLIQILSSSRMISSNLITISGQMKQTKWRAVLESTINLLASVILVNFIGMYGVLLGTIIALLYRTNDIILYSELKILHRNPFKTYKVIILNGAIFVVALFINPILGFNFSSYSGFILLGIVLIGITIPLYFIINFIFSIKEFKFLLGIIMTNISNKNRKHLKDHKLTTNANIL